MFEVRFVNSEFIALVAYSRSEQTLRVITYNQTSLVGYDYRHVQENDFLRLSTAPSVGSLFNRIKLNHSHSKLDPSVTSAFYRDAVAAQANTRVIV